MICSGLFYIGEEGRVWVFEDVGIFGAVVAFGYRMIPMYSDENLHYGCFESINKTPLVRKESMTRSAFGFRRLLHL